MSNFDLSNQNDEVNEGLTSTPVAPKNDNDGLTSAPTSEVFGDLSGGKPVKSSSEGNSRIKCPNCGSKDIEYAICTVGQEKNWVVICLLFLVFWPAAIYKLLKNKPKKTQVRKCKKCGKEF